MDKKIEKSNADKIKRKLAQLLKPYGFTRTKATFYTRVLNDRIEFVHLHKFTFGPRFRAHIGIRFLCDEFEAVALNGPDSDIYRYNNIYTLEYSEDEESLDPCAAEILAFVIEAGFPWFKKWRDKNLLLNSESSPLTEKIKSKYTNEIIDELVYKNSFKLLGIKDKK